MVKGGFGNGGLGWMMEIRGVGLVEERWFDAKAMVYSPDMPTLSPPRMGHCVGRRLMDGWRVVPSRRVVDIGFKKE